MIKPRTHFEQVPLETVRRIIEEIRREAIIGDGIRSETLVKGFAEVEEPSAAEFANFVMGSQRNNS